MSKILMESFNRQPRLRGLSTGNLKGEVDCACFGSPRMTDESTIVIALGKNRTLDNLLDNPHACYLIMEPAQNLFEWRGVRLYSKMKRCETSGESVETMKTIISEKADKAAAQMIFAALTFTIEQVRLLADFGQGCEKSILSA